MQIAYESLATEGASAIAFLDATGETAYIIDALGLRMRGAFLRCCSAALGPG